MNFGPSILEPGAKLIAPVAQLVPRNDHSATQLGSWDAYGEPTPGFPEEVFFFEMQAKDNQTAVLLQNAAADRGVEIGYNTRQLPCFSQWKNTTAYADGYVTGLEPGTNFPNPRSFEKERNRVVELAPGEARDFVIDITALDSTERVTASRERVAGLQAAEPKIHSKPLVDWCA